MWTMIKLISIFVMRFKNENLKNSALLYIAFCAFALLGSPLYCGANFSMNYHKNLSLELLTGYDDKGNFHTEQFNIISNTKDIYHISTFGRVKSFAGKEARILKQVVGVRGYCKVSIIIHNKKYLYSVHRLVSETFIPNPKNKPVPNHKDLNKTNNCVWNLEWMTNRQNTEHYYLNINKLSKYVGVCCHKNRWVARINYNGVSINLGSYKAQLEAHEAYLKASIEINKGSFVPNPKRKNSNNNKCITFNKDKKRWVVRLTINGKRIFVGSYKYEEDAIFARNEKQKMCLI